MQKSYKIDNRQIAVSWQEIKLDETATDTNKVVVFFPGWPLKGHLKATQKVGRDIALHSKSRLYIITTRTDEPIPNSLYMEAMAVCSFIEESGFVYITIVGYSQGGIKAINTAIIIQNTRNKIFIGGLILISPLGLIQLSKSDLFKRYAFDLLIKNYVFLFKDSFGVTSLKLKLNRLITNVYVVNQANIDFFVSLFADIKFSGTNYLNRFNNEISEMVEISLFLQQIRIPIILVQGSWDRVSNISKISTTTDKIGIQKTDSLSGDPSFSLNSRDKQEEICLFPQSPFVRILNVKKFGVHLLLFYRSNSIARVTFYLLSRAQREVFSIPSIRS